MNACESLSIRSFLYNLAERLLIVFACICRNRWGLPPASGGPQPIQISVRRNCLLEDGFSALRGCGSKVKGKLQVSFVNLGVLEAGLDHGGLVKEFLEEVK